MKIAIQRAIVLISECVRIAKVTHVTHATGVTVLQGSQHGIRCAFRNGRERTARASISSRVSSARHSTRRCGACMCGGALCVCALCVCGFMRVQPVCARALALSLLCAGVVWSGGAGILPSGVAGGTDRVQTEPTLWAHTSLHPHPTPVAPRRSLPPSRPRAPPPLPSQDPTSILSSITGMNAREIDEETNEIVELVQEPTSGAPVGGGDSSGRDSLHEVTRITSATLDGLEDEKSARQQLEKRVETVAADVKEIKQMLLAAMSGAGLLTQQVGEQHARARVSD